MWKYIKKMKNFAKNICKKSFFQNIEYWRLYFQYNVRVLATERLLILQETYGKDIFCQVSSVQVAQNLQRGKKGH